MIGHNERYWSWLYSVVVPAVLVATEATWMSAWISALAQRSGHNRVDIPFLALALPAVAAVVLIGLSDRLAWSAWKRFIAAVPVMVVGIAVSAGIVSMLQLHGSFGAVSTHFWTVTGRAKSGNVALAWFVGSLAWFRGAWLGWRPSTFGYAVFSVALSSFGFIFFFLFAALQHHSAFRSDATQTELLFLLFFPGAIAVLALINESELERQSLHRSRARPNMAWLAAVGVPMAVVAALALLIVFVIGPLAPILGHGISRAARWVRSVVVALGRWLSHFFTKSPRRSLTRPVVSGKGAPIVQTANHVPAWIWVVVLSVLAIVVVGLIAFLLRALLQIAPRLRRAKGETNPLLEEEKDSVFSWGHMLDQIRGMFRRFFLLFRRRPRLQSSTVVHPSPTEIHTEQASIRAHYRHLLHVADATGQSRQTFETPREFRRRLASSGEAFPDRTMREITTLYEHVRYGDAISTKAEIAIAARDVEEVSAHLITKHDDREQSPRLPATGE